METMTEEKLAEMKDKILAVQRNIGRTMVGQGEIITQVLTALLCGGHILLEGVPGLGKTLLIRSLAETLDLESRRIQFTPDLMPADILGTRVLVRDGESPRIAFQKGPVFTQILLADEINRATPKTQSALLEAMQENQVTLGGEEHPLAQPFMVLATQNPLEMEGTFPLPEAQMDRFFFKLLVPFPTREELGEILERTTRAAPAPLEPVLGGEEILDYRRLIRLIPCSTEVRDYAVRITLATHPENAGSGNEYGGLIRHGASPRAAQSLILGAKVAALLDGRIHLTFQDIRRVAKPALRHRILLSFEGETQGIRTDDLIDALLKSVPERA